MLRCNTSEFDWLAQFLIEFGRTFIVRQPPKLVAALEHSAVGVGRATERGGTCAGSQ